MRTNTSVLTASKDLTFGVKYQEETYKGYTLISTVLHCGHGGNYWLTTVLDPIGIAKESFCDDAYCVTFAEATQYIDKQPTE